MGLGWRKAQGPSTSMVIQVTASMLTSYDFSLSLSITPVFMNCDGMGGGHQFSLNYYSHKTITETQLAEYDLRRVSLVYYSLFRKPDWDGCRNSWHCLMSTCSASPFQTESLEVKMQTCSGWVETEGRRVKPFPTLGLFCSVGVQRAMHRRCTATECNFANREQCERALAKGLPIYRTDRTGFSWARHHQGQRIYYLVSSPLSVSTG